MRALRLAPALSVLLLQLLLPLLLLAPHAAASVYPVKSNADWVPPFQHAEKMFATDRGPVLSRSGNSSVTVRLQPGQPHCVNNNRLIRVRIVCLRPCSLTCVA